MFATAVSGLYTPLCAEGGLPVCATNGRAYLYFENECRLNAYIYKQLFLGQLLPVKTDLENCLLNCHEIICPALFKPVCAEQVPDGPSRTVPNACLVNQLICATKRHWKIVGEGHCIPSPVPKPLTRPSYSYTSTTSERYQISDKAALSASYADQEYSPSVPVPVAYSPSDQHLSYATPSASTATALSAYDGQPNKSYTKSAPALAYNSYNALDYTPDPALNEVQPPIQYLDGTVAYASSAPCSSSLASDPAVVPATHGASDQSLSYVAPVAAPKPYAAPNHAPSSYSYSAPGQTSTSAPCSAPAEDSSYAGRASASAPAQYATPDQSLSYVAPAPVPGPYAAPDTVPASYSYSASAPSPTSATYAISAEGSSYASPVAANTSATYVAPAEGSSYAAAAPATYAAIDTAPAPYEVKPPTACSYSTPAPAPATYAAPDQNPSDSKPASASAPYPAPYQSPINTAPVSATCATAELVSTPAPYEVQAPAPCSNSPPAPAPAPAPYTSPYAVPTPATYNVQPSAAATSFNYGPPTSLPYTAPEQIPTYVPTAPSPALYNAASPPTPCETQPQEAGPYRASPSITVSEQSQSYVAPAPLPYAIAHPEIIPASSSYQVQVPIACTCSASTAPANAPSSSYATASSSYTTPTQLGAPAAISSTYSNPAQGTPQNSIANIYSRLPGSLNLAELFQRLRGRFSAFIYQPRYIHIIYNTD
ncbi:unnamed protein product [Ceratitis capitata]|uniref:(Mediterranean fruit fly) hypothetical protein n=1 Tax=Ceratitis capitata TaxID=7213 RepID=A0A811VCD1_CERCA|nr:unnamed protein product [Ceratitis capitata]